MTAMPRASIPKLPQLLGRKIYKTGQTRGADDDEIFQNRVSRTSTVLIQFAYLKHWTLPAGDTYENGFIVLIRPGEYFGIPNIDAVLASVGLVLGVNAVVFYETRPQWMANNPDALGWTPADKRAIVKEKLSDGKGKTKNAKVPNRDLGGKYVARISATTADDDSDKIIRGFARKKMKGAGIRVYEYASADAIAHCRLQLEALFWKCYDADIVAKDNKMSESDILSRKAAIFKKCEDLSLLDISKLTGARILNSGGQTICPLCLKELSAQGFFNRMEQAEGRAVLDLTITQLNLFHIEELRLGEWNHRSYNLGWGHHHCNVVVKDDGITKTLEWMRGVVDRNIAEGHLPASSSNAN
jgi:hypothetical protein